MSTEYHQIQIFVRHVNSSKSQPIMSASGPDQIDELAEHMRSCGIHCEGDVYCTVSIQYVVDDSSCFVEFIVGEDK